MLTLVMLSKTCLLIGTTLRKRVFADFTDKLEFELGSDSLHPPYRHFLILSYTQITPATREITAPTKTLY